MAKYKAGFIGCGNMGGALLRAVAKSVSAQDIAATSIDREQSAALAKELGIIDTDKEDIAAESEVIFLCVKPQNFPEVIAAIAGTLKKRTDRFIVVSIAAGLKISAIADMLGGTYPIIRCMPNTPVAVDCGMIAFCNNELITDDDVENFRTLMSHAGKTDNIGETLMDAECSVAGCGPAFAAMFAEGLAYGGEKCGLSKEQALSYALQTMKGTAELIDRTGVSPEELVKMVCSPGGSTIEGVKKLNENGFLDTVAKAVEASYKRNVELGK